MQRCADNADCLLGVYSVAPMHHAVMDDKAIADLWRAMSTNTTQSPPPSRQSITRAERIAQFNRNADERAELEQSTAISRATTFDFARKSRSNISISTLRPIGISSSRVLLMKSAMVLVEDDSDLTELAIYSLFNVQQLAEGRRIAIMEPYFRIRADGTTGICVDNPTDLVLDVEAPAPEDISKEGIAAERVSVEMRLQELMIADVTIGSQRLHQMSKKQVQALKKPLSKSLLK
jgi:hypothetical protein